MKSFSPGKLRIVLSAACGVALVAGIVSFRAQADQWDKRTILTIAQPIQVSHTLLQPGQYVFKLLDSGSNRHIVQIFNGDQTHIIDTILAIPNYRLQPTGSSRFAFWETPPGYAKALRAWFYPGDNFGQEFRYPKQLALLETTSSAKAAAAEKTETAEATTPPAPEAERSQETERQQPVETARAAPPPAPQEQPAPEQPAPKTLPKTASPYPLAGFAGLIALCLYGMLRLKRTA